MQLMTHEASPPVLLLVFNRKNAALSVLRRIAQAGPARLFIAADGPRPDKPGECERCAEVRQAVLDAVTWPCEVTTLFRDTNLGCRKAVSSAITWFFDHVESGIVLEDDCLPALSFFRFCGELLGRYQNDPRILSISADCFTPEKLHEDASYYFSKYQHCWGWASWRRAWRLYDAALVAWPSFKQGGGLATCADGNSRVFTRHFAKAFDDVQFGRVDSWALQWMLTGWVNGMLTILPATNMVQNTGFGGDSTHTRESNDWMSRLPACDIAFPLVHPASIRRNIAADRWSDVHLWHIRRGQALIQFLSRSALLRLLYHRVYMKLLLRNRQAN